MNADITDEMTANPMVIRRSAEGEAKRTMFGYTTDEHPLLDRIQNGLSMVAGLIAGTCLVALVALTCTEVVARLVFGKPLGWNVAFTEKYLLVGSAFFGIVTAYRSGAHVAVTSIFEKFPFPVRKGLLLVTHVLVVVIFALVAWFGLQAMLSAIELGEVPPIGSTELSVPEWVWKSFVPVASAMALIVAAIDLAREALAGPFAIATDYEPGDFTTEDVR
ncbi:TRAP transporter small permease subunit [Mycolicibacterium goodii]|uniref:TRAP transporter small permease n=1 Tax=Mycolicibacterium goodii TaxID=134601 RepID=UPI001F04743C|nr:TRAP transporter small permease [Mycolicibacterium goodii]ULN49584.1 TRAP transporter small permease subunit [Mycolicibacterium goodii]